MYSTVAACCLTLAASPEAPVKPIELQILIAEVTEGGEERLAEELPARWTASAALKEALVNPAEIGPAVAALKKSGDLQRVSAPTIRTLPGREGVVQVGQVLASVTGCDVVPVGTEGQKVLVPWNESFQTGITLTVKPRFCCERQQVSLRIKGELGTPTEPQSKQIPSGTMITPVFEGGPQGQPVPFTQVGQQPTISTVGFEAARRVPHGKSLIMVGWEHPTFGFEEMSVPLLGDITGSEKPFTFRRTVTERRKIMVVVTPKVVE